MIVGAAGDDLVTALLQPRRRRARIGHHLLLILLEFRLQRFEERHGFRGDDVHERAALRTREHQRVEFLRDRLVGARQDQSTARTAQRLVRGGGDDIGVRDRIGIQARRHQARDVRHVDEQIGADRIGDLAEFLEVEVAGVGGETRDYHFGFFGQRLRGECVVVDFAVVRANAVLHGAEEFAGEIHLGAVREVTAVIETHAEDGVAGL